MNTPQAFRSPLPSRWSLVLGCSLLWFLQLSMTACQPPVMRSVSYPDDVRYAAAVDSLDLTAYLMLQESDRRARRHEADRLRLASMTASSIADALQALHSSVGLNPADVEAWLLLALRRRWFGDYRQVEKALVAGREALPHQPAARRLLAAELALCEAWLRYDRGEWRRGLAAVDSAVAHGADREAVDLMRALHLAGEKRDSRARHMAIRFARRDHRAHWIHGVSYWRLGLVQAAHGIFNGEASTHASGPSDFVRGPMRPTGVGAAESYRDHATVEELLGNWWLAQRNYVHSARAVPHRDDIVMARVDHQILGRDRSGPSMPIWLAFDRYYVTGSLSAYTALAFRRFEAAEAESEREFWASMALDAAGICIRLNLDTAWARRVRGLVFVSFEGQQEQARRDLEAAQRWFENRRIDDLRTLTTLGRLHLSSARYVRARPLLERAVDLAPDQARLWSDLGLVYIHLDQPGPAMEMLTRALYLDAGIAAAWYNRGLLRYHGQDLAGAVADLEQAHLLEPGNTAISRFLDQLRQQSVP